MKQAKPLILVVEDDQDIRICVTEFLQFEGYEVIEADNGSTALDIISRGVQPNVMLTDIMMPVMDGFELMEKLSSLQHLNDMEIICFTASTMMRERIKNACKTIWKPFDMNEVLAAVSAAINKERTV